MSGVILEHPLKLLAQRLLAEVGEESSAHCGWEFGVKSRQRQSDFQFVHPKILWCGSRDRGDGGNSPGRTGKNHFGCEQGTPFAGGSVVVYCATDEFNPAIEFFYESGTSKYRYGLAFRLTKPERIY
jgi:hypothetical protein